MQSPRWHQSYLDTPVWNSDYETGSFMFGTQLTDNSGCLPSLFVPFLHHINQHSQGRYTQVTVNWYADGLDYTAQHADCEKGMIDGADIAILTLGVSERQLKIRSKASEHPQDAAVPCPHGTIIKMCGEFQKKYRHGVPKCVRCKKSRISITFRQMRLT